MAEGQADDTPTALVGAGLDVAAGLMAATTLHDLAESTVAGLHRLVGGDLCVFNVLGPDADRAVVVGSPVDAMAANPDAAALLITHGDQHPQISGWADGSVLGTSALSDFLGARAFHRLALYQGVFRPVAVEDVLTATFSHPREGTMRAVSVLRGRRGFTATERTTIGALAGVARAAHDRIVRHQALHLLAGSASTGAVVVLGPDQQVVRVNAHGQEVLEEGLGIRCEEGRRADRRLREIALATVRGPYPGRHRLGPLVVTAHRSDDGSTTVLQVEPADPGSRPIELDLTPRQGEVLDLIAQGRSNREIATALGISDNTVRKHLEHLYARLGVSNRTEAAAVHLRR